MIKLGLVGFGRTGSVVARDIIEADAKLGCIFRKTDMSKGHDIGHLLGYESEIGVKMSPISELEEVLSETNPDVIIDFSCKDAVKEYLPILIKRRMDLVICSTGWEDEEIKSIKDLVKRRIGVVMAPNITEGINILITLARLVKQSWPTADIEIVETHFTGKKDVSGTAMRIAEKLSNEEPHNSIKIGRKKNERREAKEIVVHSVRTGGVVGKHEVVFGQPHQVLRLIHESVDRHAFGRGAIRAAKWVSGRKGYFTMDNVLNVYQ